MSVDALHQKLNICGRRKILTDPPVCRKVECMLQKERERLINLLDTSLDDAQLTNDFFVPRDLGNQAHYRQR